MRWGRIYFAAQAVAGLAWWIAVGVSPFVRQATLGDLNTVLVAWFDIPLFVVGSALAALGVKWASLMATGWTCLVAVGVAIYATVTTQAGWGVLSMAAAAGASVVASALIWFGRVPTELLTRGPFAFRPARARSTGAVDVALTLGQMLVFWGIFLAAVPIGISWLERRWNLALALAAPPELPVVGICLLILASALGVASAITMSTRGQGTPLPSAMPNRLVISGPYRWIRNPMAVAGIMQGIAVGVILSSWLVVVYAVVGSVLWNYAIRPLEEADLRARFGEQFEGYCESVRCWIPRSPRAGRYASGRKSADARTREYPRG